VKYINKLTYVSYDGFIEMDNIHNNYDSVLELDCKDITTEDKFWFYFGLEVLPYWENEVIRVTSGSMQPRQFDVYCVMSRYDDF